MASGGQDGEGRMPKDMKELLKMCVTAQPVEGVQAQSEEGQGTPDSLSLQPMSEERKQWLESALTEMSVSPVQRMKECLQKLSQSDTDVDDKIAAVEELIEWCEHIDYAIDFHKIGGYEMLPKLIEDEEAEIRWLTLELVAALVQNNPYCQTAALEKGLLPQMLHQLDNDPNATVKVKALYAISCLTRNVPEALKGFLDNDGLSVVMRAMQTDVEKLKIKAAFMLSSLCDNNPEVKDILCKMGMVDQLVGHLGEEHAPYHEHVMSAILVIIRDHPGAQDECRRRELNLNQLLKQRIQDLQGKDESREEIEYATEILELLKGHVQEDDENNDVAR